MCKSTYLYLTHRLYTPSTVSETKWASPVSPDAEGSEQNDRVPPTRGATTGPDAHPQKPPTHEPPSLSGRF